jgi:hypothetical protein
VIFYNCFYFSNTYIFVIAIKGVKNVANDVTDKTKSAIQGAGRKGGKAVNAVGKETTNLATRMRKSIEHLFGKD